MGYRVSTGWLAGLRTKWQGGNANKLKAEQREDLYERLAQYSPDQVIAPDVRIERGEFWTVSDLQIVVEKWYGVTYRRRTSYRHLLHASGLSY